METTSISSLTSMGEVVMLAPSHRAERRAVNCARSLGPHTTCQQPSVTSVTAECIFSLIERRGRRISTGATQCHQKRDAIQCEELSVHGSLWSACHPSSIPLNSACHGPTEKEHLMTMSAEALPGGAAKKGRRHSNLVA